MGGARRAVRSLDLARRRRKHGIPILQRWISGFSGGKGGGGDVGTRSVKDKLGKLGVEFRLGSRDGRYETGVLASLADGSVVGRDGDTVLLVTACSDKIEASRPNFDSGGSTSVPLSVDYRAKASAAGQIPTHVLRRELAPREADITTGRLLDRALRPLFPPGFQNPTQVVSTVLSFDGLGDAPSLALNCASLALTMAPNIPFQGPIGCVRVGGRKAESGLTELTEFPSATGQLNLASNGLDFELLIAGTPDKVVTLDLTSCSPIPPDALCEALRFGLSRLSRVVETQRKFLEKSESASLEPALHVSSRALELEDDVRGQFVTQARQALLDAQDHSSSTTEGIKSSLVDQLLLVGSPAPASSSNGDEDPGAVSGTNEVEQAAELIDEEEGGVQVNDHAAVSAAAEIIVRQATRQIMVDKGARPCGRPIESPRSMRAELDLFHNAHASAAFSMGMTSVIASITLGRIRDAMTLMPYCGPKEQKHFFVHYEMPPYSTASAGRIGLNRRMISHGDLIERALFPTMPNLGDFPYTTRAVCETTCADGSTSMASVAATSMALRAAGIPVSEIAAGVSIGLLETASEEGENCPPLLLTDIDSVEGRLCDMNLKIAGTASGITAAQLDSRQGSQGFDADTICKAIMNGDRAIGEILAFMDAELNGFAETCQHANSERQGGFDLAPRIPRVEKLALKEGQAAKIIGQGGSRARSLEAEFNVNLDIDQSSDMLHIYSLDEQSIRQVREKIEGLFWLPQIGDEFDDCQVIKHVPNGCVVAFSEGQLEGLMHVSEVDIKRIDDIREAAPVGTRMKLKVISVDEGRIKLSRRAVLMGNFSQILGIDYADLGEAQVSEQPKKERIEHTDLPDEARVSEQPKKVPAIVMGQRVAQRIQHDSSTIDEARAEDEDDRVPSNEEAETVSIPFAVPERVQTPKQMRKYIRGGLSKVEIADFFELMLKIEAEKKVVVVWDKSKAKQFDLPRSLKKSKEMELLATDQSGEDGEGIKKKKRKSGSKKKKNKKKKKKKKK